MGHKRRSRPHGSGPVAAVLGARATGCWDVSRLAFEAVTIKHLEPMGGYAVHLAFSDEHARGIFPWTYLPRPRDRTGGHGATDDAHSG